MPHPSNFVKQETLTESNVSFLDNQEHKAFGWDRLFNSEPETQTF